MPGPQSIDGLISNLNTTQIVDAIINAQRGPVTHLTDRQTLATNQLTTYNSISALIVAARATLAPLLRASAFQTSTVSVSDDTVLDAVTSGRVGTGTYSLSVDALATNHQIASQGFEDPASATLGTGSVQVTLGNGSARTFTVDNTNNSLAGLKSAINTARMGVTATIVDDGSAAHPFRLLLSADATGKSNTISVTASLSGGLSPNFATASFDGVEKGAQSTGTAKVAVGPTAAYTGNENKTYEFTVGGSGAQTMGGGPITINWTDGTNAGSFQASTADAEVALMGTGADGLKLSVGAGTLVAGDTFEVQTFAPLLQQAGDARVFLGSVAGGGSPITISSATNQITDLIPGLTLKLKSATGTPVTVTADIDRGAIKANITSALDKYNEVMRAIDKQFTYNSETKNVGVLLGDSFLLSVQNQMRSALGGAIKGLPKGLNTLGSVGIRTAANGLVTLVDPSKLADQLSRDPAAVQSLFVDSGVSTNPLISFLSAGPKTAGTQTGYDVDVTQAPTRPSLRGAVIADPESSAFSVTSGTDDAFRISVDGVSSDSLALGSKTYHSGAELAADVQAKINADSSIGTRGVSAAWVDLGDTGYLEFTSGSYGAGATLSVDAPDAASGVGKLGFGNGGTFTAGQDVQGTINGELATGVGRVLSGNVRNATTDGLRLDVGLSPSQLVSGPDATVTFMRGFAARLDRTIDALSRAVDGSISRRTRGIQAEVDDLKKQIDDQEARLAVRREKLFERFTALETALSQFQSQGNFLTQQLNQIAANTQTILSPRSQSA